MADSLWVSTSIRLSSLFIHVSDLVCNDPFCTSTFYVYFKSQYFGVSSSNKNMSSLGPSILEGRYSVLLQTAAYGAV